MRDQENNIKTLVDFGISRTQAKIYLALAEKGTLTIRAVSDYSGVGRPDSYRAMLELKKAGLIEIIIDSPTKYRAIPLADAIAILMGYKHKEMLSLKEQSSRLLQQFENRSTPEEPVLDSEFIIIPKGPACIKKRVEAIRSAEFSFDCLTSFKRFNQTLLNAGDDIIEAANRGVKIRFILDKFSMNKPLSKEFEVFCNNSSCEVKFISEPPQSFVAIFDKREIQMATSEEGDFTQIPILWSNNSVLVRIGQHYFDSNWAGKTVLSNILEEIKITHAKGEAELYG
jgi:sugar-specific transcriptional regulator TrmB